MNRPILASLILSVLIHGIFMCLDIAYPFTDRMPLDVVKAPSCIEVSMVYSTEEIEIRSNKIEEESVREKIEKQIKKETVQGKQPTHRPVSEMGALTEEVSSLLLNQPPAYPMIARLRGWEGRVCLLAKLKSDGTCKSIEVFSSSGYPCLDEAAVSAVKKWRFRNLSSPIGLKIPIKFLLNKKY